MSESKGQADNLETRAVRHEKLPKMRLKSDADVIIVGFVSLSETWLSAELVRGIFVKVLFFQHAATDFMLQLAEKLNAAGITIAFVCTSPSRDFADAVKPPAESYCFPMKSRLNPIAVLRLRQVLNGFKPDIIYCSTALACFNSIIAQLPGKRSKLVCYRGAIRKINWMSPSDLVLFKSQRVDLFHCLSSPVAESLRNAGVSPKRLTVFPAIGYSLSEFKSTPLPASLQIRNARFRLGAVANYRRIKGLEYLVDAMELLVGRGADVELILVGEDPDGALARYIRKSPAAPCIFHAGPIMPPWSVMRTFDCLAVPSLSEGLNKTIVEAFACEVPVVATNVGGIPDAIVHGKNGLLVPPRNPGQLADAIEKVLTDADLATRLKSEGKRTFFERFEASVVASKYVELFNRVAA